MIFMTGSSYRSRVFGYNFSRIVLIFAVLLLCVYFLTRRDQTAFIACGLLVSLAIFFNVGVLLNDEILRISVLGIPVSNVRLESLKGGECPFLCVRGLGLQVIRESVGVSHG